jgi:16S rRNA C967 or C1407 C5-methylase (RsmB/RsmF family)
MTSPALERYRDIVPDWAAFLAALERPLPTILATNTTRLAPDQLAARLRRHGVAPQPLPWLPSAFRLPPETPAGRWPEYRLGLYHLMEEVSQLPAVLLGAQPGERVLDLCAAPGGKSVLLAQAMANRGTLIANDIDHWRLGVVRLHADRLGLANLTLTIGNGSNYPTGPRFDRVLADVPCSCLGTTRKSQAVLDRPAPEAPDRLAGLQLSLLRKALLLCRPGGRVVYSTCTYAPEENEAIVHQALAEAPGTARLLPVALPGLVTAPGLTSWAGQTYAPELRHALRLWPHLNDTGGFFVAVLEKLGTPMPEEPPPAPPELLPADAAALAAVLARYDFAPALAATHRFQRTNKKELAILPADHLPAARPAAFTTGLAFCRTKSHHPRLTSQAARAFGHLARHNVITLAGDLLAAYLRRETFPLPEPLLAACDPTGFLIVRDAELALPIGLALLRRPEPATPLLESLFPADDAQYL